MSEQSPAGVPVCYRHPGREAHIRCQRCDRPICPDCMHSASVGFQCPECLAAGHAGTRRPRTAYGGVLRTNHALTTLVLIGLNVVVWLAITATGGYGSTVERRLQLFPPAVRLGDYWQLLTTGFTHVEPLHLFFNCLFLYLVGPQLEMVLGRTRFLATYLVSILAGSTLVYAAAPLGSQTVGASGGTFGMMGALLVILLVRRLPVQQIVILIAANFAFTFLASGISWQAHVGGILGGAAVAGVLTLAPRGPRRTTVQVLGIVGILVVLAVVVALRSASITVL